MITTASEPSPPDQRSLGVVLRGLDHPSLWRGQIVVIKYGGAAMGRAELQASRTRLAHSERPIAVITRFAHHGVIASAPEKDVAPCASQL